MAKEEDVTRIMSRTVYTLTGDQTVRDAVAMMAKKNAGSVVVIDGSRVVGIITERDVVRKLGGSGLLSKKLSSIATKPVVTVSPNTQVWEAFSLMLKKGIRRLPVVKGGKVVGIVTERDLLKWVVGVFYEPNVPADIKKLISQN
jgi:CBS domain-containing protein